MKGEDLNIDRIMIPVDFSDTSRKAFYAGLKMASVLDADTHLLHVEEPLHDDRPGSGIGGSGPLGRWCPETLG